MPMLTHCMLRPLYYAIAALALVATAPNASDAATFSTQAGSVPLFNTVCNVTQAGSPATCSGTYAFGSYFSGGEVNSPLYVGQAGAEADVDNNGNMHAGAAALEYTQDQSLLIAGGTPLRTTGFASANWIEDIEFAQSSSQFNQDVTVTATLNFIENFGSRGQLTLTSPGTGAQERCSMVSTGTCTVSVLGDTAHGVVLVEDMSAEADAIGAGANGVASWAEGTSFISSFQTLSGIPLLPIPYTTTGGDQLGGPGIVLPLTSFGVGATQGNPILPNAALPGGGFPFSNLPNGDWIDPNTAFGYHYQMTSDSLFTNILNFPTGFASTLAVTSPGCTIPGEFGPGMHVDFDSLCGHGVSSFDITGISPLIDPNNPSAFPVELLFSTQTADLVATPLTGPNAAPEPSSLALMSFALAALGLTCRKQRASKLSR